MVNNVTGDTSTDARPPLHPQGMYDGLTTAYNVVTEVGLLYCPSVNSSLDTCVVLCVGCVRHCY